MDYYFPIAQHLVSPIKGFVLSADTDFLYRVDFVLLEDELSISETEPTAVHHAAQQQIELYLAGELNSFDLPLHPQGTEFQQSVWREIGAIGFGHTSTYGDIAKRLGNLYLSRAVGQAANKNPLPLIIPCHRVVGKGGKMTGFASGIATKTFLLGLEMGVEELFT